MPIKKLIFIFLLLGYLPAFAQKKTKFSPQQIREDMTLLKNNFMKFHPAMDYTISAENYQKLYDSLSNHLHDSLSYFEAFRYISPLVISMHDGHTSIHHAKNTFKKNMVSVPIFLRKIANDYYISYNCSEDTTLMRGAKLLAVDDVKMDEVVRKISTLISRDADNQTSVDYYATFSFNTFYLKYFGEKDSVKLSFQPLDKDSVVNKKIKCLSSKQISKNLKARYKWAIRANLSVKLIDTLSRVGILNITSFSAHGKFLDIGQWKFKRLLHKQFANIKKANIKHLIVDMRGNGGGFIPNIKRLMKYLAPEPFTLSDTVAFRTTAFAKVARPVWSILSPIIIKSIFPKRENGWYYHVSKRQTKPYENLRFKGDVYFLMNGGSYSATTFTLALANDMGIGKFIGEQAGGSNWGSFAATWYDFKLPHTRIKVHEPLFKIQHKLLNNRCNTLFLQPDYLLGKPLSDFKNKHDNYIDFTLDLIRK